MGKPHFKKVGAVIEIIVPGSFSRYLKSNAITIKAGK